MMQSPSASSSSVPRGRALAGCTALLLGLAASMTVAGQTRGAAPHCRADGPVAAIQELPEASGIAASRTVPGRLWSHNDSGHPMLFALDTRGSVTGRLRLSGAGVDDWEALAVGPCPAGSCLYVADIGDNDASRKRITIYRVQEPSAVEASVAVKDVFHATYPDGAHDAEALLVTPAGGLFIVTKGDTGAVALYRFPSELRPGATHQLERVGKPRGPGKPAAHERITDGSMSADGQWVVLRTEQSLDVPSNGGVDRRQLARRTACGPQAGRRSAGRGSRHRRRQHRVPRRRRRRRTLELYPHEDPGRRRRAGRRGRARERPARARVRRGRRGRRRPRARAGRRQRLRSRHPRRPPPGRQRARSVPADSRGRHDRPHPDADRPRGNRPARRRARCGRRRLSAQAVPFSRAARAGPCAAPPRPRARGRGPDH